MTLVGQIGSGICLEPLIKISIFGASVSITYRKTRQRDILLDQHFVSSLNNDSKADD